MAARRTGNPLSAIGEAPDGLFLCPASKQLLDRSKRPKMPRHPKKMAVHLRRRRGQMLLDQLWYAASDGEKYLAVPVQRFPFHLRVSSNGLHTGPQIEWTHPLMSRLARLTVRPCEDAHAVQSGRRRRQSFDVTIPCRADKVDAIGVDMARYTLGAMGDDDQVDLPGVE
jgi:hypothetical protein